MLLYGHTLDQLLEYFRTLLEVLTQQSAAIKLKSCKWFQDRCNFLGIDRAAGGTQPAYTKKYAFSNKERPNTCGGICMLIGIFVFYSHFFPYMSWTLDPGEIFC